jgi:hypothetical protein
MNAGPTTVDRKGKFPPIRKLDVALYSRLFQDVFRNRDFRNVPQRGFCLGGQSSGGEPAEVEPQGNFHTTFDKSGQRTPHAVQRPESGPLCSPFDHRQHHLPYCPQNGRCISLSHTPIRFPNPSVVRLLISGKIIVENAALNTSFTDNKLYAHIVRDVFSLSSLL